MLLLKTVGPQSAIILILKPNCNLDLLVSICDFGGVLRHQGEGFW